MCHHKLKQIRTFPLESKRLQAFGSDEKDSAVKTVTGLPLILDKCTKALA
jgi:hypothetical protein